MARTLYGCRIYWNLEIAGVIVLALSDAFKAFLFTRQVRAPLVRMYFEKTGIDPDHGLKSYPVELTELVDSFGSITRELNIENGVFRPGGNTIIFRNTKDFGDYLLSLRKRFGDTLWNDKSYHIFYGFKEFPTAISVAGTLLKLATLGFGSTPETVLPTSSPSSLGFGDTATGEPSIESVEEETVRLYTGDTQRVIYDRLKDTVEIVSKDFYQRLVEFKVCKTLHASYVFRQASGVEDTRQIQQLLKIGQHKFIAASALSNKTDPFSCGKCIPNISAGEPISTVAGTNYPAYHSWYLPVENYLDNAAYTTVGNYKLYYWDYIDRIWRSFTSSYFDSGYITVSRPYGVLYPNLKGLFFNIVTPASVLVEGDTWMEYLVGTGSHFNDPEKVDVAVCAESKDAQTDCNPARVIYELISNERYAHINEYLTDLIDFYKFTSPKESYTFDSAFIFFRDENININVDISKETSLAKVVEEICGTCGINFYISADKSATSRRCIRIKVAKVHNPCTEAPPNLLRFSTKDRLIKYDTELSKDEKYDRVEIFGFNSTLSTKENFENAIVGTGNNPLVLGSSRVYFYDSYAGAQGIAGRLYNKFSSPTEIVKLVLDAVGLIAELADYIKVHDHKLDEEIVVEIYKWAFDLKNQISLEARRYTKLYGPEENNTYKKYAFCGCAYAGTNAKKGSGFSAYIYSGDKTVTLGVLENFDLNVIKIGMAIRISSYMFWIASITSSQELEVDTAATADLSSEPWSIGNSYHAR